MPIYGNKQRVKNHWKITSYRMRKSLPDRKKEKTDCVNYYLLILKMKTKILICENTPLCLEFSISDPGSKTFRISDPDPH